MIKMVKVPERLKDEVYKATLAEVTREKLIKETESQKGSVKRNNKGGRS